MGVQKGFLKAVVLVHPSLTRVSVKRASPVFGLDAWYTISCNQCYLYYYYITKCIFSLVSSVYCKVLSRNNIRNLTDDVFSGLVSLEGL